MAAVPDRAWDRGRGTGHGQPLEVGRRAVARCDPPSRARATRASSRPSGRREAGPTSCSTLSPASSSRPACRSLSPGGAIHRDGEDRRARRRLARGRASRASPTARSISCLMPAPRSRRCSRAIVDGFASGRLEASARAHVPDGRGRDGFPLHGAGPPRRQARALRRRANRCAPTARPLVTGGLERSGSKLRAISRRVG